MRRPLAVLVLAFGIGMHLALADSIPMLAPKRPPQQPPEKSMVAGADVPPEPRAKPTEPKPESPAKPPAPDPYASGSTDLLHDKKLLGGILLVIGVYLAMRVYRRPPPPTSDSTP